MIENGYFLDTEVFGTPLVGKGKGTPCLFCQESVKKVIIVREPASSFFIPHSQQVPVPYHDIS